MDRASTFSDPKIIRRLQTEFIPVVGDTHEVQNGRGPVRDWFMQMASSANPRVNSGNTAQGFYIASPDGQAFGFNNNRSADRVDAFMSAGLKAWQGSPRKPVDISAARPDAKVPRGVAVVRVFSRISPLPEKCGELNKSVGRDHLWIYPEEAAALWQSASANSPVLPASLTRRVVRFHLVDNVRGEPDFWRVEEVRSSHWLATARKKGTAIQINFSGSFSMSTASQSRGLEGRLEGVIDMDQDGQITGCMAYGESQAWGAGTYTPSPPAGKFPLLFGMKMVSDEASRVVPPQGLLWGSEYRMPGK